jgi:hypothetical protein
MERLTAWPVPQRSWISASCWGGRANSRVKRIFRSAISPVFGPVAEGRDGERDNMYVAHFAELRGGIRVIRYKESLPPIGGCASIDFSPEGGTLHWL